MIEKDDWRLAGQEEYLAKKPLVCMSYRPYSATWEHDHCAFCSDTIDANTNTAYCTLDQYHWICKDCFEDFKEMFQWEVVDHSNLVSKRQAGGQVDLCTEEPGAPE